MEEPWAACLSCTASKNPGTCASWSHFALSLLPRIISTANTLLIFAYTTEKPRAGCHLASYHTYTSETPTQDRALLAQEAHVREPSAWASQGPVVPQHPDCLPEEGTAFVREGRTGDGICLSFTKTLDMVFLNVLVPQLGHCSLDGWRNRWAKHQLEAEAERAVVKGSYPTRRSLGPTGTLWGSTGASPGQHAV